MARRGRRDEGDRSDGSADARIFRLMRCISNAVDDGRRNAEQRRRLPQQSRTKRAETAEGRMQDRQEAPVP